MFERAVFVWLLYKVVWIPSRVLCFSQAVFGLGYFSNMVFRPPSPIGRMCLLSLDELRGGAGMRSLWRGLF